MRAFHRDVMARAVLAPVLLLVAPVGGIAVQVSSGASLPPPPSYTIARASSEMGIDARLDEPAWDAAEPIPLVWEWFPGDNVEPPVESVCRVTYDDSALYIGCVASDPRPGEIRAYLSDRDRGFQYDHFSFLLDPFNDRRRAFQFRVTALGVQMDAVFSQNEGFEDFSWDTIWESEGRITDDGYVVEVAIPFKSLRFPRAEGVQTWGFIFERSYPRSSRHRITSGPRDRNNNCLLCQANEVTGFTGISPGNDVELDPTLTAVRTERRDDFPEGDLDVDDEDVDAGLTARWGITPNVTFSGTVNPDFSQVEADAAQLEVNQRFTLFFPEKRPFFLEGADFFEVPGQLVFTRTVADPVAGAKVTGKERGWAFGGFVTRDRVNNLVFPGALSSSQASLSDDVTGAVARVRRDVGEASTIGALVTSRDAEGYSNRLAAVDGFLRLSTTQSLRFLASATRTDYPDVVAEEAGQDPRPFEGYAWTAGWSYNSREWFARASYDDVGADFRADFGFLPQVDFRGPSVGLGRVFWGGSDRWYNRIEIGAEAEWNEDQDGFLIEREYEVSVGYQGPLQSSARAWVERSAVAFAGEIFELTEPRLFVEVRPTGWLLLRTFVGAGDEVDFANARKADEFFLSPEVELRIGRPLELSLEHTFQRLSLDGDEIFTANLTELRALYHFSVRAFFRAIVQYRHVDRVPGMFVDPVEPETERVFSQLLFSYKLNPQTVLFAGYSDNRAGTSQFDLTQSDRTFFLKLGYAWRL